VISRGLMTLVLILAVPAWAQDIDRIQVLTQQEFRLLSEDLGGALSYRPQIPTAPLGITGFDIGIAITGAKLNNEEIFERATSDDAPSTLPIPTLRAHKGLPLGFDIGLMYAQIPGSDIKYYGGELKYAFVSGNVALPAIGLRGSFTKVSGIEQMDFDTRSLDLSISKGFVVATPYAGIGRVWVKSDPKGTTGSGGVTLRKEEFELDKFFIGLGLKLGLFNLNLEGDKTGDVTAFSAKMGLRF
jgi:hypothetical protein